MRLIDANAVEVGFNELCQSPYFKNDVSAKHGAETLMDLCVRSDSHKPNTIDPETLPIVRQLREENEKLKQAFGDTFACDLMDKLDKAEKELARVTAERDAAVSFIPKTCATCKYGKSPCDWCKTDPDGDLNWEWNGKQKEE